MFSGILSFFNPDSGAGPCQTIHGAAAPALASSTPKACAGAGSVGMVRRCVSCPSLLQRKRILKMPSPSRSSPLALGKTDRSPSMTHSAYPREVLQIVKLRTRPNQ